MSGGSALDHKAMGDRREAFYLSFGHERKDIAAP